MIEDESELLQDMNSYIIKWVLTALAQDVQDKLSIRVNPLKKTIRERRTIHE